MCNTRLASCWEILSRPISLRIYSGGRFSVNFKVYILNFMIPWWVTQMGEHTFEIVVSYGYFLSHENLVELYTCTFPSTFSI